MKSHNSNALPIACSLTGREAASRKDSTAKILLRSLRVLEIENGYEFVFPGDSELVSRITELVVAERKCCLFLTFEILFEAAEGPIRLRVTGPDGAKDFIREELNLAPRTG